MMTNGKMPHMHGPHLPNRHTLRLRHYDYSRPGAYFITICTNRRLCVFGDVRDGVVFLNPLGRIVHNTWIEMSERFAGVYLDLFAVMPNHFHGILMLTDSAQKHVPELDERPQATTPTSVPAVIGGFKSMTAMRAIKEGLVAEHRLRLWQRNYYEHAIRSDGSLTRIREYIDDNPAQWSLDRENPWCLPSARSTESTEIWMV